MLERPELQSKINLSTTQLEVELPNNLQLSVMRVKNSGEQVSNMQDINLICEARKSYLVYGEVPLLDEYDEKSTIYLATARYPVEGSSMFTEEHITMRLVPANGNFGEPSGTEDLALFVYKDYDGNLYSAKDILKSQGIELESVATISRLGKIPSPETGKNEHIAELFAAIQVQAVNDASLMNIKYIVCQLHNLLHKKILSYKGTLLDFVPAEKQLNLHDGDFHLNRWDNEAWDYTVRYPGYFYNIDKLKDLLLNSNGMISSESNLRILDSVGLSGWESLNWKNARFLGKMISNPSLYEEIGEDDVDVFKTIMRENAEDGVFLALMKTDEWRKSAQNLLKTAQENNNL